MNGAQWWEGWYAAGADSGPGSRGAAGQWKADQVNRFVVKKRIHSVFDFGCGDGQQLALLRIPLYVGYDPSPTARARAQARIVASGRHLRYRITDQPERAELALSMDVLYHLVDDVERASYLAALFALAGRFVLIYTTRDSSHDYPGHVQHREPPAGWSERIDSPDPENNCSFFVYHVT